MIDLMAPRYKVTAPYPNERFVVGDIIPDCLPSWTTPEQIIFVFDMCSKYPHLFRKMHWSEERKKEYLPEYVKYFDTVFKVTSYSPERYYLKLQGRIENNGWDLIKHYTPATLAEYESYQQQ